MELRDLEYFSVVAEHGNLRRAAEELGMSQPALSKSLRRLEKSARAKVVKRTPDGVELTTVGKALLKHAHRLRLAMDDTLQEVADLSDGRAGHVRIGLGTGIADVPVAAACSALLMEAPRVTLALTVASGGILLPALVNGEHDLIITGLPAPASEAVEHEHLYDDDYVVFMSRNHRLTKRKAVKISDLANERWAVTVPLGLSGKTLERAFEENGLPPPQIVMASSSLSVKLQTLATSDLLSFSSKQLVQQVAQHFPLRSIQIKEMNWHRNVGISYRKNAYLSPAARRFIELLKFATRETTKAT